MNTQKQLATERARIMDAAVKTLAVVGIISLLALGTWTSAQLFGSAPQVATALRAAVASFSATFFPAPTETIRFNLPSLTVRSDEPMTISWERTGGESATASYALVYECADNLSMTTEDERNAKLSIACGEPYAFSSAENTLTLIPHSPSHRFLDATLKLALLRDDSVAAEKSVLVTIVNERLSELRKDEDATSTIEKPAAPAAGSVAVGASYPVVISVPAYSDPNGYVDLEVRILSAGIISDSGAFISGGTVINRDYDGGVQFTVTNIGTKESGEWSFEAELPTRPRYTFTPREMQQSLLPGERIEYTLGFNRITSSDTGEITVEIDPDNDLDESVRSNNTASITVTLVN